MAKELYEYRWMNLHHVRLSLLIPDVRIINRSSAQNIMDILRNKTPIKWFLCYTTQEYEPSKSLVENLDMDGVPDEFGYWTTFYDVEDYQNGWCYNYVLGFQFEVSKILFQLKYF